MGRSRTSKRVTWAADVNLCQMRVLGKNGMGVASTPGGDEELPPGFDDIHPTNLWRVGIPLAKWRCPPRFEVNREWQVVSGEESNEIQTQNSRQTRLLEAIYPRPSAIPPNPRAPGEAVADDGNTPVVSLTPIEDVWNGTSSSECTALASNADQINLIHHDLLLRILADPKILQLQNIITSQGAQNVPDLKLQSTTPPHTIKDANYYKTLIQLHGIVEKRHVPLHTCPKFRDESKTSKFSKPCIYFNSPRGCRNGDNCAYQHVTMSSQPRVSFIPSAKRVKLS